MDSGFLSWIGLIWEIGSYVSDNRPARVELSSIIAVVDAYCEAWNKFMLIPEWIASITQRLWASNTVSG